MYSASWVGRSWLRWAVHALRLPEQALAGPVQVDVVRAARLRRLAAPTTNGGEIPLPPGPERGGGENSYSSCKLVRERWRHE
eukprot:COSAG05_NODE_622_length_8291_cov_19.484985_4_plen_82_part_00